MRETAADLCRAASLAVAAGRHGIAADLLELAAALLAANLPARPRAGLLLEACAASFSPPC